MNIREILIKNQIEVHFKNIFGENLFYILFSKFKGTEKQFYEMLNKAIVDYSLKRNKIIEEEKFKIIKLKKLKRMIKKLKQRNKK